MLAHPTRNAAAVSVSVRSEGPEQTLHPEEAPGPLWLALHFPCLPLEALGPSDSQEPRIVCESKGRRAVVRVADDLAQQSGVRPGLELNVAYAMVPTLEVNERIPAKERDALQRLAIHAGAFTPTVCIDGDGILLLEISGSRRLYGGLNRLLTDLCQRMQPLGYRFRTAVMPTPASASLIARTGETACVTQLSQLVSHVGWVPISHLDMPARHHSLLTGMGIRCVQDLLRLPRADLARRLSPEMILTLDRLVGREPDPRRAFAPPVGFTDGFDLPWETTSHEQLLPVARALLERLQNHLAQRQGGVVHIDWLLSHVQERTTKIPVRMTIPRRQASLLFELTRTAFDRTRLPRPVNRLAIQAPPAERIPAVNLSCIPSDQSQSARYHPDDLPDLLGNRLGSGAVRGIRLQADHRPERAWLPCAPGKGGAGDAEGLIRGRRPVWLLHKPKPLQCQMGHPCMQGVLLLHQESERLVSGWWDGHPVARDYFRARRSDGSWLWVFKDLNTQRWYLHGVF
jgi:protein ImuB